MRRILLILPLILFGVLIKAQVGIGTENPNPSAILDIQSSDSGLLLPRVKLDLPLQILKQGIEPAEGLIVYNESGVLSPGLYIWTGATTGWKILESALAIAPSIGNIDCEARIISPTTFTQGVPYTGTLRIPYTDGNGGNYSNKSDGTTGGFTQNGLTFTLRAGRLNEGSGEFVYDVKGTPDFSSPTIVTLPINILGKSCSVEIGQDNQIQTISFVRNSVSPINAQTPLNSITTIGSLSVRFNGTSGSTQSDIQIRLAPNAQWNGDNVMVATQKTTLGGDRFYTNYLRQEVDKDIWISLGPDAKLYVQNYDAFQAVISLIGSREIYRLTVLGSNSLTATANRPSIPSGITLFIERLQ